MTRFGLKARLAAAAALALILQACDDRGGRVDAPEPPSLADMAAMSDLPYAEPARVDYREPAQGYAWAERAYGLQRAVYDTPPDYGFEYDGAVPLAWETEDDWAMYAEPWDDGYRYYYYEPGVEYPYFVRDADYGYAYDAGGILVAVFDAGGRYLARDDVRRFAPVAGRYWVRGHELRGASARRVRVSEQAWRQRAPQFIQTADPWMRAAREDRRWQAWRAHDQERELRRFARETERREHAARGWRQPDGVERVAGLSAYEGWSPRRQQDEWRREEGRNWQRQQAELQAPQRTVFASQQRQGDLRREPPLREELRRQGERQALRQAEVRQQQQAQREQTRREGEQQRMAQARQQQQAQRQQAAQQQQSQQQQARREQMRRQGEQQRMAQARQQQQAQRQQAAQQQQSQQQQARREQMRRQGEQQRMAQARQQQQAQRQQMAQQQQAAQARPQARAAEQRGQPASAREHGPGGGHGRKD
ncbi:hypothetical protein [Phenylobacterium sp.]|uniref:hypothetical protein n=1 Tax=Phenylobacterium sp. TaxID=1871053 RepID=UPI0025E3C34C|nr:hypothetical protein [Phenylobacterium sp.]